MSRWHNAVGILSSALILAGIIGLKMADPGYPGYGMRP
jgi:hypothetical protein